MKPPATTMDRVAFAPTEWSIILAAGKSQIEPFWAAVALAQLCQKYWPPLYSFVRSRGYAVHDAQDLTQSFFAYLIENKIYARADRQQNRFRSFLLAAIKNFIADAYDREQTLKRGGGREFVPLDEAQAEAAESLFQTRASFAEALNEDIVFGWKAREPIRVGQTSSEQAVPAVGSLGLLAAGAAGLVVWRRRRSKSVA